MRTWIWIAVGLASFAICSEAFAQGYIINTPGRLPTYANPNYGGGYTINTPGQLPTTVNPNYGGGYTVNTPGRLPTTISPCMVANQRDERALLARWSCDPV